MELVREGRVWVFGNDINTDLIFPNRAFRLPEAEQYRMVFAANRPGWVDEVREGDIVVAGQNFSMGSGRPVGRLLGECGIRGVVAESVNGLGMRNCVNYGMPALDCPGVTELFEEGQTARIDYVAGRVENLTTGRTLQVDGMPQLFLDIIASGGVIPMLVREGYVEPQATNAPGS